MYENKYKGNEAVRQLRSRQAKNNTAARREILDEIESTIPCAPRLIEFTNGLTVRTEIFDEVKTFRAKHLRTSTHFPGIVPELVSDDGKYMLITWLTYGSLLRLLSEARRSREIKDFGFFM